MTENKPDLEQFRNPKLSKLIAGKRPLDFTPLDLFDQGGNSCNVFTQ